MFGCVIKNFFVNKIFVEREKIIYCYNCLILCNFVIILYCIIKVLINVVKGNVD